MNNQSDNKDQKSQNLNSDQATKSANQSGDNKNQSNNTQSGSGQSSSENGNAQKPPLSGPGSYTPKKDENAQPNAGKAADASKGNDANANAEDKSSQTPSAKSA